MARRAAAVAEVSEPEVFEVMGAPITAADVPMPFKSLKERRAENPEAFAFSAPQRMVEQAFELEVPLSAALGGLGTPIVRKGKTFFPQSPALEDLDALIEQTGAITEGLAPGATVIALASFFLYLADPCEEDPEQMRRATAREVGKSFRVEDIPLLEGILSQYGGMALKQAANSTF